MTRNNENDGIEGGEDSTARSSKCESNKYLIDVCKFMGGGFSHPPS
jgi:hypothetical protein